MQYLYHVFSLREPVFIRPAELGGIQQVFFIKLVLLGVKVHMASSFRWDMVLLQTHITIVRGRP